MQDEVEIALFLKERIIYSPRVYARSFTLGSGLTFAFALTLVLVCALNQKETNLSEADLSNSIVNRVMLDAMLVENTRFDKGFGFAEDQKRDLRRRGAIFDDEQEESSSLYFLSPVRQ